MPTRAIAPLGYSLGRLGGGRLLILPICWLYDLAHYPKSLKNVRETAIASCLNLTSPQSVTLEIIPHLRFCPILVWLSHLAS